MYSSALSLALMRLSGKALEAECMYMCSVYVASITTCLLQQGLHVKANEAPRLYQRSCYTFEQCMRHTYLCRHEQVQSAGNRQ